MASLQLGERSGGRQASRRQRLTRVAVGPVEASALTVSLIACGLAVILVGILHLASPEALGRTSRLATLWGGYDHTLIAVGYDRPPLLTALATPFAAFPALRAHGLAAALGASVAAGAGVLAAAGVARRAGLHQTAAVIFIAAFALNPLLLFAAATGQPEALLAALLLASLGQFASWLQRESTAALIGSGVALGLAFWVRYDVVLLAPFMAYLLRWVGRRRQRSDESESADAQAFAFLTPVIFMVGLWTLLDWFPAGDPWRYLGLARDLAALGSDSQPLLDRMASLRGDPLGALGWGAAWSVAIGPLSAFAAIALLGAGIAQHDRPSAALGLACLALPLPAIVSVVAGGQPLAAHLAIAIVPAFVAAAFREQRLTDGVAPEAAATPHRRTQTATALVLLLGSLLSAAVIPLVPRGEQPGHDALDAIAQRSPRPVPEDVAAVAVWIASNVQPGDVLADSNRHAEVILETGNPRLFRTDADRGEEATLFDPSGLAGYILARRPLDGAGRGRIERSTPNIYADGRPSLTLAFEAGDYRVYRVIGPAIP
ncbi:MAG: hypothetical protein EPO16_06390 [Dehalococcoidia bacterium]|nr:MAG: hypothetical protein EPO16_06390 [Dehalococcoidia bacterium]